MTLIAFAIPRRVGSAVVRNRLRRQLRAILVDMAPGLPTGSLLISVGPELVGRGSGELRNDMVRLIAALDDRLNRADR